MSESIELATILTTDLVSSTRLATSVGPVRADELRDEHFALIRGAIQSSGGREVKNTGDGLVVAFGSASAAVGCAVLMQQMFERRYRRAEQPLHIRIGIGAGESTVQDGDYFGMPSIEAARLCGNAPTDGIMVSATVRMLAARAGVVFESAGELELKGFPEPVEAFLVSWAPLAEEGSSVAGGWPLPAVLRAEPRFAYVGREAERGLLERARAGARSDRRQVVLLSGEPGIGKTRLAAYAAHGAHADGFSVCWGACSEDVAAPYEPWIEVCTQLVEHAPAELLATFVERHGGEISRIARNLPRRIPAVPGPQSSDPETERYLLFSAVAALLETVSGSVPLFVTLDDFHWADGQSVALLRHVARTVETSALVVAVTYRDSDLGKDHPLIALLADLRRLEGVERIALDGLDAAEVSEVVALAAGHELDQVGLELAGEIATETGGNPFFVGEVLTSLAESGRLLYDKQTGRWTVDRSAPLGLPESVRDVVGRRVERLGDEAREVLTVGAVIGRSFELELLARLVEVSESRLLDHLESAVASALLVESTEYVGRFQFSHGLINQTLYETLGPTRRARMHHRVALALEELCGPDPGERVGELALHWRLATAAVDPRRAASYSSRAGQRALENLAPAEAVRRFSDALELLGPVEDAPRCLALIGLGEAQKLTGQAEFRGTLLEASRIASVLADAELAARAALANTRGWQAVIGEIDSDRVAAIDQALELDDRSDPGRRAVLLALQAQELLYEHDPARRHALAIEAIELAHEARDPRITARALFNAAHALWCPETLALRARLAEEIAANAAAAHDRALEFWAEDLIVTVSVESADLERARIGVERIRAMAVTLAQPILSWTMGFIAAGWALMQGDLTEGERLAKEAFEFGHAAGQPDALLIYGSQRSFAHRYLGFGAELIDVTRRTLAAYPRLPVVRAHLAQLEARFGSSETAAALLAEAVGDGFRELPTDNCRLEALVHYADAAAKLLDVDGAAAIYELLEPSRDQFVWTGSSGYGHVRLWLGVLGAVLGRDAEADEHFQFACRFHSQHGLKWWEARSEVGWAVALARRGDDARASAREHALRALEVARANGYPTIEAAAAEIVAGESAVGR